MYYIVVPCCCLNKHKKSEGLPSPIKCITLAILESYCSCPLRDRVVRREDNPTVIMSNRQYQVTHLTIAWPLAILLIARYLISTWSSQYWIDGWSLSVDVGNTGNFFNASRACSSLWRANHGNSLCVHIIKGDSSATGQIKLCNYIVGPSLIQQRAYTSLWVKQNRKSHIGCNVSKAYKKHIRRLVIIRVPFTYD